ncbi:MAG: PilN domain-containing protein [Gammaproteobacteria bacterium]|nr:PilN domain-containing protein [Gammaproteobacteria bacterium]
MESFDLIPTNYRRVKALKRLFKRYAALYITLALVVVGAKLTLTANLASAATRIEKLRSDQDVRQQTAQRVTALRTERDRLRRQVAALDKLRLGPPVRDIFSAVDRSLHTQVWFRNWRFFRAGEFVEAPEPSVSTGLLIVVPADGQDQQPNRGWRVRTHMEIDGTAKSHSILADFVRRLDAEPVVQDVKIIRTRGVTAKEVVDFELAVVIAP